MQFLEVSCAVRFIYTSLGAKGLNQTKKCITEAADKLKYFIPPSSLV